MTQPASRANRELKQRMEAQLRKVTGRKQSTMGQAHTAGFQQRSTMNEHNHSENNKKKESTKNNRPPEEETKEGVENTCPQGGKD